MLKHVLTRYNAPGVPWLHKLWGDGDYQGEAIRTWVANVKKTHENSRAGAAGNDPVECAWRSVPPVGRGMVSSEFNSTAS